MSTKCGGEWAQVETSRSCDRLNCRDEAKNQITLQTGEETTGYHLCSFHYYQALAVLRGIQVTTGMIEE